MTGFAEKKFHSPALSVKVSIRSLNHRFFDWSYRGVFFREIENKLRIICQKKIARGRVDVLIDILHTDSGKVEVQINESLLKSILSSLKKLSSQDTEKTTYSLENLFAIPHVVEVRQKDLTPEEEQFLESCFEKTLDELVKERKREGREITSQIKQHLQKIKRFVVQLEKQAKKQPFLIRKKLEGRIRELSHEVLFSEDKLVEEAAYLAQKYDLTEEIARLKGHLKYAQELISQKEEHPVGKKLDFFTQELYRETNTINAKSQDMAVIQDALRIKNEIESIRQQVQNLE